MFEYLKKIFLLDESSGNDISEKSKKIEPNEKIKIAACALFIEMAKVDGEFTEDEKNFIITEMKNLFILDDNCTDELMQLAEKRVENSVSIYEFSSIINSTFTQYQKIELLESLWRLIYRDKKLSAYEDQLIKRIGGTLNLEHKEIINAKLLVKEQLGLK